MKTYPQAPGHKGEAETSRQAAKRVASNAERMREDMLFFLRQEQLTHDECAARMRPQGMTDVQFENFKRSVRSRGSELKAESLIEDSGLRRNNDSGSPAVVWRLKRNQTATVVVNKPSTTATSGIQTELL